MKDDELYLRKASPSDIDILFQWVNDNEVRNNSFDTHYITHKEHMEWFNRLIDSKNQIQYILMKKNTPIGQVRLTINGSEAEIGYSIASDKRGCGYGNSIIALVVKKVKEDFPGITRLIGKVKPSNMASLHCFENNGFEEKFVQLEVEL